MQMHFSFVVLHFQIFFVLKHQSLYFHFLYYQLFYFSSSIILFLFFLYYQLFYFSFFLCYNSILFFHCMINKILTQFDAHRRNHRNNYQNTQNYIDDTKKINNSMPCMMLMYQSTITLKLILMNFFTNCRIYSIFVIA